MPTLASPPVDPAGFVFGVLPLVRQLAGRYSRRAGLDGEDLAQDALLALIKAVKGYDPARGKPGTYAGLVVKRAAYVALCRADRQRHIVRSIESLRFEGEAYEGPHSRECDPAFLAALREEIPVL